MELLPILNSTSPPTLVMVFSASELPLAESCNVDAALVKSRTNNQQLLTIVKQLIKCE